jgi:hypothetical protein
MENKLSSSSFVRARAAIILRQRLARVFHGDEKKGKRNTKAGRLLLSLTTSSIF